MLRIVTESDSEFRELNEITSKESKGYNYTRLASEINRFNNAATEGMPSEKIVITYPHSSISNLVYALKRRGLIKDLDFELFKLNKNSRPNKQQILVQPLGNKNSSNPL